MAFAPNWAAIAQILGGALAAPDGQYAQGAQQGAQAYQGMQSAKQDQQYREQQMRLAQQQADQQAAQFQSQQKQDQAYYDYLNPKPQAATPVHPVGNYGAAVGGAPGAQTASGAPAAFANLSPEERAFLIAAGPKAGLDILGQQMFQKADWEIKTVREGDQEVTYRINTATGQKEKLGSGLAFKPGSDGNSLSIAAPVWGMDAQGNPVLLQMSPSGVAVQTQLPQGVTPVRPNVSVDTGTGTAMVSPITGQSSNVIPKDIAGKESAEVQGAAQGQAVVDLPGTLAKAKETRELIQKLRTHPGRVQATGGSAILPIIPGTAAKDFDVALNQAKGGVFLQAYQQLKGGGAITQVEGEKAEQAIARLDRAQSEGEFLTALNDLDAVISAGEARMRQRAGSPVATPEDNAGGWQEIDGVRIRVKP